MYNGFTKAVGRIRGSQLFLPLNTQSLLFRTIHVLQIHKRTLIKVMTLALLDSDSEPDVFDQLETINQNLACAEAALMLGDQVCEEARAVDPSSVDRGDSNKEDAEAIAEEQQLTAANEEKDNDDNNDNEGGFNRNDGYEKRNYGGQSYGNRD